MSNSPRCRDDSIGYIHGVNAGVLPRVSGKCRISGVSHVAAIAQLAVTAEEGYAGGTRQEHFATNNRRVEEKMSLETGGSNERSLLSRQRGSLDSIKR